MDKKRVERVEPVPPMTFADRAREAAATLSSRLPTCAMSTAGIFLGQKALTLNSGETEESIRLFGRFCVRASPEWYGIGMPVLSCARASLFVMQKKFSRSENESLASTSQDGSGQRKASSSPSSSRHFSLLAAEREGWFPRLEAFRHHRGAE